MIQSFRLRLLIFIRLRERSILLALIAGYFRHRLTAGYFAHEQQQHSWGLQTALRNRSRIKKMGMDRVAEEGAWNCDDLIGVVGSSGGPEPD